MKITIPKQVADSIKDIGNKTAQKNAYKIYASLVYSSIRKNQEGYFAVPSTYLKSINAKYNRTINKFIKDGIIKYFERAIQVDLFTTVNRKYYNKRLNTCMKYKFLIDIKNGDTIEIDMNNPSDKRWYNITKNTLIDLGYTDTKVSRDNFGRRVHHSAIRDYKTYLSNKGLSVIDAKCSQPRLLYLIMKKRDVVDESFNEIFDNGLDFYNYLIEKLDLKDRKEAKDLFMFWAMSEGYVPNAGINKLFPVVSGFIKTLKNKNHKDASAFLQREEAKIWIDDLLENIPTEFALTIHDSLIVKTKEVNKIKQYCISKYPQIEFDIKEL